MFELEFLHYIKKIILTSKHFVHFFVHRAAKYLHVRDLKLTVSWFLFMFKDDKKKPVSGRNKGNIIKLSTMTRKKNSQDNLLGN